jgi:predicted HTH domain antitoxin
MSRKRYRAQDDSSIRVASAATSFRSSSKGPRVGERRSFVIPKHLRKSLRELEELTGEDQSSLLRKLLDRGIDEAKMDIAVDRYVKEKSSLEQSSAIAGVSLWRLLDELRQRKVALKYSMADAEAEIEKAVARKH